MLTNKIRKESQVSLSSVSDYQSDDSEDNPGVMERKTSLQELVKKVEDKRKVLQQRSRSLSDSETRILKKDTSSFEVFPSLPDSVLEKLGLRGDGPKEQLNEEELEEKFTSLGLAFTIDSTTIKDRCERQRRFRNQTETNLNVEVNKLKEKVTLMQPFCRDYEKAELFSTIMTQVDTIMNAASLALMSAERFGSVQHEDRLTESVRLMVNYVQSLKQQKEATKKQLQYTKRVLQNSADSPRGMSPSPTNNCNQSVSPNNVKLISKRRASIATFSQQVYEGNPNRSVMEFKKITRRTSDLNLIAGSLNRRPTRLELGGDLMKIKENNSELAHENELSSDIESEEAHQSSTPNISSTEEEIIKTIDVSKLHFRDKMTYKFVTFKKSIIDRYNTLTCERNFHDFYTCCAILCFSIGLLSLLNVFAEYEFAKMGILSRPSEGNK